MLMHLWTCLIVYNLPQIGQHWSIGSTTSLHAVLSHKRNSLVLAHVLKSDLSFLQTHTRTNKIEMVLHYFTNYHLIILSWFQCLLKTCWGYAIEDGIFYTGLSLLQVIVGAMECDYEYSGNFLEVLV